MPHSHHSHSGSFCRHGHGALAAVVEAAIARGFETYGLSEHMPRYRAQDLYADEAGLTPADLHAMYAAFVAEARRLQREHAERIRLLVGCESDWITPDFAEHVRAVVDEHRLDYFVGSVHHVHEIPIDFSRELFYTALARHRSPGGSDVEALNGLFAAYYDAQLAMLEALRPPVIGHFDLIKMYVPAQAYAPDVLARIRRNVRVAVAYGALFELNSRAFKKGIPSAYPMPDSLAVIVEEGGRFALSDDCHGPNDVAMHYDRLRAYIAEHALGERIYYLRRDDATGAVTAEHAPGILANAFWSRA
eukprot:Unigene99_Nuclearia_a/m.317 Unigene99_Nuclearia_a/g.317  ORF Unigene99_Nuclearia_a/g.317 Unigene99_Nuclearia_a/m.317 type:complete len:304 (-) Unigene99_Nuclearia_a:145-1056(-)